MPLGRGQGRDGGARRAGERALKLRRRAGGTRGPLNLGIRGHQAPNPAVRTRVDVREGETRHVAIPRESTVRSGDSSRWRRDWCARRVGGAHGVRRRGTRDRVRTRLGCGPDRVDSLRAHRAASITPGFWVARP